MAKNTVSLNLLAFLLLFSSFPLGPVGWAQGPSPQVDQEIATPVPTVSFEPVPATMDSATQSTEPLSQSLYTMEDLKILAQEKSYEEFFEHALDIRPSLRSSQWKEMVSQMGQQYLDESLKARPITAKIFKRVESLVEVSLLKENEFFMKKRGQIGLLYLESCFTSEIKKSFCQGEVLAFWRHSQNSPELGLKLAELVKKFGTTLDIWTFLAPATLGPLSEFWCKEKVLQEEALERLKQITMSSKDKLRLKKQVFELISPDCMSSLKPSLKLGLSSEKKLVRDLSYNLLSAVGGLDQEDKDFYALLFFLEGPVQGDSFNESWNTLGELGRNYPRREKALQKLRALDPLPGQLFALSDQKKRRILMGHLYKNIPEYMDHYARTCLHYLTGEKSFENGNPTLQCHDLFQAAKGRKWIEGSLELRYIQVPRPL